MVSSKDFLKNKANLALVALILAFFIFLPQSEVKAIPSEVIVDIPATTQTVVDVIKEVKNKWWQTWAAKLVGTTLRNTVNRIAYDAASAIATTGEGQKPLWIVEDLGTYIDNLGDAAVGDFIDGLGKKWGADLCQPSDPNIQIRIGLGLVGAQRPSAPNCSLTKIVANYTSAYEKYKAMKTGDYLKAVQVSFEPGASEIGAAYSLFGKAKEIDLKAKDDAKTAVTVKQGWLDVRSPAGKLRGLPDNQKTALQLAQQNQSASLLSTTGDALVDAANIFLNQLAYEGMQRGLRELGKLQNTSSPYNYSASAFESSVQYGEKLVSEKLSSFIKPRFDVRSDYTILSDLSVCPDKSNPGPNNCVIDANFSQAISEKLTVAEAFDKGYLHPDWTVSINNNLENTYNLRSASILRKFRIVPVAWEEAITNASTKTYPVTLRDLMACFNLNDSYEFNSNFNKSDAVWCQGLVDPNWLLKAPLSTCLKQGSGGQILSSLQTADETGLSSVQISRADDYCADEQSCIKENADGSCAVNGYCNEEKRTWNFNAESCEPVYNTCQGFTNLSTNQSISYLQNTLDYSTCNKGNAGCRQYVYGGTYDNASGNVSWDKKYSLYLDNDAQACNSKDEACTQLLRGKPNWSGVNFVMNSDFSNNVSGDNLQSGTLKWPVTASKASIENFEGSKALYLEGMSSVSVYSNSNNNILPKGMTITPGWSYTLSADVYLVEGYGVNMSFSEENINSQTLVKGSWQTLKVSVLTRDQPINDLKFSINGTGSSVKMYVRNIQLSPNDYSSNYSNYGAYPVYEKLIPAYLESACYVNSGNGLKDYRLKDKYPGICDTFARKCNSEEAGCQMYTSIKDNFKVAAKAQPADECKAECSGYDTYIARESYFYNSSADNIIPSKSKTCSAQSAGCSGFTNLDDISQGGEKQQYYTYIRQCIKPNTNSCGDFYSWEGTNGGGYQLKAVSLKKDSSGNPALVSGSLSSACTKEIYYLPTSDPRFNSDCREFYNKNGSITYRLLSNTFSCSDNCHPYRLNEKNIDSVLNSSNCNGNDKHWDAGAEKCYVCKNGGVWNSQYNSCLYNAVPDEGLSCAAAEEGCREYNGNNGGNLRIATSYNFESGIDPFKALSGNISQSIESTSKDGHSLLISGGEIEADVSGIVKNNASYVIKFMAKSATPVTINAYFENSDKEKATFNVSDLNKDGNFVTNAKNAWSLYEINVAPINHDIKDEKLKIKVSGALYIDNIVINEINDRFYLIKGSSNTPLSCYDDIFGKYQGTNYNLGCSLYKDPFNNQMYLHRFSELCQDSAAGCEQMIETNNSLNPYPKNINLNDTTLPCATGSANCLSVPGHKITYAVYSPKNLCIKGDAGCTRFAYSQLNSGVEKWVDSYKKNLPDNYDSILCQSNEIGCEAWSQGENKTTSYFKDPNTNVCIFKSGSWYRALERRCDIDSNNILSDAEKAGANCNSNTDCGSKRCIDYPCEVTYLKTMGNGGAGGLVPTPSNWAGICDNESSGCTEFIDPVSSYMTDVLIGNEALSSIPVKQNALYIVKTSSNQIVVRGSSLRMLGADNKLGTGLSSLVFPANTSLIFNSGSNSSLIISTSTSRIGASIKEVIINYKNGDGVDLKTCNGIVSTENGCILFNNRSLLGGSLKYNAKATAEGKGAVPCVGSSSDCSANQVIKVRPDRICSRWLSCTSYVEDPVTFERTCYSMGECDKLNDENECANVIAPNTTIRTIANNPNSTGYSLLNNYYLGSMKEVGQNTDAHFDFENSNINLSCKRLDGSNKACEFVPSITKDSLILEPKNSPAGIDYGAHGKGYLRVLAYYKMSPQPENSYINIYANQDYYINYLVHTVKDSPDKAKLIIVNEAGAVIKEVIDSAPNGWERKVVNFRVSGTGLKKIKIYLTTDVSPTSTQTSYVYFDDINIEPVLKVSDNKYVAKDCRLYPGADSLTCLSINNNVVKDGLYGYCLQYDPLNPKVCLMWYPVEKISPVSRVNQTNLGYKGKFPLYYCTEVDGNFKLVKKMVGAIHTYSGCTEKDTAPSYSYCAISWGYDGGGNNDGIVDFMDNTACHSLSGISVSKDCGCLGTQSTLKTCGSNDYYAIGVSVKGSGNWANASFACIPKQDKLLLKTGLKRIVNPVNQQCIVSFRDGWVPYDGKFNYNTKKYSPPSSNALDITMDKLFDVDELNNNNPSLAIYDYTFPPSSESNLTYPINDDPSKVFSIKCNKFTQLVDSDGSNMAWSERISRSSVYPTTTPAYFVGTSVAAPTGGIFNDSSLNKNYSSGGDQIYLYGRNREDVPFGAAILPNDYSLIGSQSINLRNQYSAKNNETSLAGRPYGCSIASATSTSPGCPYIGQCSMNPNIFCIYTANADVDKLGCASSGAGQCVQLWKNPLGMGTTTQVVGDIGLCVEGTTPRTYNCSNDYTKPCSTFLNGPGGNNACLVQTSKAFYGNTPKDSINILSKIFAKNYANYRLSNDASNPIYEGSNINFYDSDYIGKCPSSGRPTNHPASFCKVFPSISNIIINRMDKKDVLPVIVNIANGTASTSQSGLYRLTFNTKVDKEQQPLKQIMINWGDSVQVVTNTDNMPEGKEATHTFYHYYLGSLNPNPAIRVKIIDNWNTYACLSVGGASCDFNTN